MLMLSRYGHEWCRPEDLSRQPEESPFSEGVSIRVEVIETPEKYLIQALLPGIPPEDIDLKATRKTLSIVAERRQPELSEGQTLHIREISYGKQVKRITFLAPVNEDKIEAHYTHGVLHVALPKADAPEQKSIEIQVR